MKTKNYIFEISKAITNEEIRRFFGKAGMIDELNGKTNYYMSNSELDEKKIGAKEGDYMILFRMVEDPRSFLLDKKNVAITLGSTEEQANQLLKMLVEELKAENMLSLLDIKERLHIQNNYLSKAIKQ